MFIQNIIANKFYKHFENELYDFTFTYKTEASVNSTTIIELCEEAVCAAHGISHQQYLDEETDVAYDEIFGDAANMTEQVINIMLQKFMEQHNGT